MLQYMWLDGALVGVMIIAVVGTLYHRIAMGFGIGNRAIQLVGICLVIPTVLILGLEDKIDKQNMGTILGAIIGYVLSGIGSPDQKKQNPGTSKKSGEQETPQNIKGGEQETPQNKN